MCNDVDLDSECKCRSRHCLGADATVQSHPSPVGHRKKREHSGNSAEDREGESMSTLMSQTTREYLYQYMLQGLNPPREILVSDGEPEDRRHPSHEASPFQAAVLTPVKLKTRISDIF